MFAFFIHDTAKEPYTELIFSKAKTLETRNIDTLGKLVGHFCLIIRTRSGHKPELVGSCVITRKQYIASWEWEAYRDETCVPVGSSYEPKPGSGKWAYTIEQATPFDAPRPLDDFRVIRHGRSIAEMYLK